MIHFVLGAASRLLLVPNGSPYICIYVCVCIYLYDAKCLNSGVHVFYFLYGMMIGTEQAGENYSLFCTEW